MRCCAVRKKRFCHSYDVSPAAIGSPASFPAIEAPAPITLPPIVTPEPNTQSSSPSAVVLLLCAAAGLFALAAAGSAQARSHRANPHQAAPRPTTAQEPALQLVREVVYNEQHDHDAHGYWRYWVEQHQQGGGTRVSEEVETADGPVQRVILNQGQPLDEQSRQAEDARLLRLATSSDELAARRKAYAEDEKRIAEIMVLLPDAFRFEEAGEANGCRHLRFYPNPAYAAHNIQAKIFHALNGELWIDTRMKRMRRLEGRLNENVDFGMGLLGRVNKGGWFEMERTQVSATEWKTDKLEVHMSGRAVMFKTIAHETSEVRGGFTPVRAGMSAAESLPTLNEAVAIAMTMRGAQLTPASYASR